MRTAILALVAVLGATPALAETPEQRLAAAEGILSELAKLAA